MAANTPIPPSTGPSVSKEDSKSSHEKKSQGIDTTGHFKIWFSKNPTIWMPPENQMRLIRHRRLNPNHRLYLVGAKKLLKPEAYKAQMEFFQKHGIQYLDIDDDLPKLIEERFQKDKNEDARRKDLELIRLANEQINRVVGVQRDDLPGNLAAASDALRWAKCLLDLGIYSDLDTEIDFRNVPTILEGREILLPVQEVLTPTGLRMLESNNNFIAVATDSPLADKIRDEIIRAGKQIRAIISDKYNPVGTNELNWVPRLYGPDTVRRAIEAYYMESNIVDDPKYGRKLETVTVEGYQNVLKKYKAISVQYQTNPILFKSMSVFEQNKGDISWAPGSRTLSEKEDELIRAQKTFRKYWETRKLSAKQLKARKKTKVVNSVSTTSLVPQRIPHKSESDRKKDAEIRALLRKMFSKSVGATFSERIAQVVPSASWDINWLTKAGDTALIVVVKLNTELSDLKLFFQTFQNTGMDINKQNKEGQTALQIAAKLAKWDFVWELLKQGAVPKQLGPMMGGKALYFAAYHKNWEMVILLAKAHYHIQMDENQRNDAIEWAIRDARIDMLALLALDHDIKKFQQKDRNSYLHLALGNWIKTPSKENEEMIRILLEKYKLNPNLDAQNNNSGTRLLHKVADQSHNSDMLQLLIKNGADLSLKDEEGNTPLLRAAKHKHWDTVQALIETSDINSVNAAGASIFSIADSYSDEIFLYLLEQAKKRAVDLKIILLQHIIDDFATRAYKAGKLDFLMKLLRERIRFNVKPRIL